MTQFGHDNQEVVNTHFLSLGIITATDYLLGNADRAASANLGNIVLNESGQGKGLGVIDYLDNYAANLWQGKGGYNAAAQIDALHPEQFDATVEEIGKGLVYVTLLTVYELTEEELKPQPSTISATRDDWWNKHGAKFIDLFSKGVQRGLAQINAPETRESLARQAHELHVAEDVLRDRLEQVSKIIQAPVKGEADDGEKERI